jgi:aspartate 1-decarboxylase
MLSEYLTSKIHMAVITRADPDYPGSLTLDANLIEAASLQPFQKILVANASNGSRFETYIIEGERGSGTVSLNGAAALLGKPGEKVIIMAFSYLTTEEVVNHKPIVVQVMSGNRPVPQGAEALQRGVVTHAV